MKKRKHPISFKYGIVKDLCQFRFFDVYTSIILKYRITTLKFFLDRLGVYCNLIQHYRSKEAAHLWSTAYQIANGNITIGDLRRLENGKDKDGNVWYKRNWDPGGHDNICAKISKNILDNAIKMGTPKMVYAEEGYEHDDPHRYPNLKNIPISKHVYGKAIDVKIDWPQLGGAWSTEADQIISQFGLVRPYNQEDWHFELDRNKKIPFPFYIPLSYIMRKYK